ncbi:S66 family peptidase [Lysinibacillus endophyticus]|uniref:S66 family peptidase n=1 Tax=Ureibacillus endophyticus TaxID=1978490 RepID=UPI0020A0E9ED|nr:S66 peptidase family protein [Lysinibacillus endophyticus]MCP1143340.1 LD-carboxypeptidase [Lysinibacillus endophyticus]
MITYPVLSEPVKIGVTAPSAGLHFDQYSLLERAVERMINKGYKVEIGNTCWTQFKGKSAPAKVRAAELNLLLHDDTIQFIFPPWGGELLIEILEYVDFDLKKPKWILGYSDTSVLLLAMTIKTGLATAHGVNLVDLRGIRSDPTTAMWEEVLHTKPGEEVIQYPSEKYQLYWQHNIETDWIYHLTEPTKWKTITNEPMYIKGRLLGGCIDVIRHLIGTPYGDVRNFQNQFIQNEPIIWYFENCELNVTDLRRSLVQMKLAGWFDNCSGILFGRSGANEKMGDYHVMDVYLELAEELNIPIAYDIDCGHMPPQLTFVNGAYAEVRIYHTGGSVVLQKFI